MEATYRCFTALFLELGVTAAVSALTTLLLSVEIGRIDVRIYRMHTRYLSLAYDMMYIHHAYSDLRYKGLLSERAKLAALRQTWG